MSDEESRKKNRAPLVMPVKVPLTKGVLTVDAELCSGCMQCMHTCTLVNDGVGSHELARIQLAAYSKYVFESSAQPCLQCVDPQCLRFCPNDAIKVDEKTGARVIVAKFCIGCQACIEACPYNPPRIRYDRLKKKAIKCDLCAGDPECVKACPTGSLQYYTNPAGIRTGYVQPKGSA